MEQTLTTRSPSVVRRGRLCGRVLGWLLPLCLCASPGFAQTSVELMLTVSRLYADEISDPFPAGFRDFYLAIFIDGEVIITDEQPGDVNVIIGNQFNPGWQVTRTFSVPRGPVAMTIALFDNDGGLTGGDDHLDISADGNNLDLVIDLVPCSVGGELSGSCGTILSTEGNTDDNARLEFTIEVEEPPSAPGQRLTCIHSPLLPDPGDSVTINVQSLDGTFAPRLADSIEIWVDDRNAPAVSQAGTTQLSTSFTAPNADSFDYGCRVLDAPEIIFSGWRKVALRDPGYFGAIPLIFTAPRSAAIDVVFVPESSSYSGVNDPQFLTDVNNVIMQAYYGQFAADNAIGLTFDLFLNEQDALNFWIARETGDIEVPDDPMEGACDQDVPDVSWSDTLALIHRINLRDCAPGPSFSSWITAPNQRGIRIVRHETGHRPFGLADEYCTTNPDGKCVGDGGYFQNEPFPNVYTENGDCRDDAPNLCQNALNMDPDTLTCTVDPRPPSSCREFFDDISGWFDPDFYLSEPSSNDLMNDNRTPQSADRRRIDWMFNLCDNSQC